MTHRDRSEYKTRSSVKAVCKSVTITGMTGHVRRNTQGAPVRYIGGDDPGDAAAVRDLDLQKKFYLGASDLAVKVGLTQPKAKALRAHLMIDEDRNCRHVFEFGTTRISRFSDNAYTRMRDALVNVDIEEIWRNRARQPTAVGLLIG